MTAPAWRGGEFKPRPVTADDLRTRLAEDIDRAATATANWTDAKDLLPWSVCYDAASVAIIQYLCDSLTEHDEGRLDDWVKGETRERIWSGYDGGPEWNATRRKALRHVASKLVKGFAFSLYGRTPGNDLAGLENVNADINGQRIERVYVRRGQRWIDRDQENRQLWERIDNVRQDISPAVADALVLFMEQATRRAAASEMGVPYDQMTRAVNRGARYIREMWIFDDDDQEAGDAA
jgi:hypothetical protein